MERIAKFHKVTGKIPSVPLKQKRSKEFMKGSVCLQGQLQDPQVMIFIHR